MRKEELLKQLAAEIVQKGSLEKKLASELLAQFKKADLKKLLFFLKKELAKKQIYVTISEGEIEKLKKELATVFPRKEILVEKDPSLIGGIKVKNGDNVLDFSVKNRIKYTVQQLAKNL